MSNVKNNESNGTSESSNPAGDKLAFRDDDGQGQLALLPGPASAGYSGIIASNSDLGDWGALDLAYALSIGDLFAMLKGD